MDALSTPNTEVFGVDFFAKTGYFPSLSNFELIEDISQP